MNTIANFFRAVFGAGERGIEIGKHEVQIVFDNDVVKAVLGDIEMLAANRTPDSIAYAARAAVAKKAEAEQAVVDQRRVVEDVRRLLGN